MVSIAKSVVASECEQVGATATIERPRRMLHVPRWIVLGLDAGGDAKIGTMRFAAWCTQRLVRNACASAR